MILGVVRMLAARDPTANRSLIWLAIWSTVVRGVIMAIQSLADYHYFDHLLGDVAAPIAVAAVLAALTPRREGATA